MEVLTRSQVADLLQVPVRTIDYWVGSQQIPHSRFALVPDAGHLAPLEQPDIVNKLIDEFLHDTFGSSS